MKLFAVVTLLGLSGCVAGLEDQFTSGRSEEFCIQSIPACAGYRAKCTLDPTRYAEISFPGQFEFLVQAQPEDQIQVQIFILNGRDAGLSTNIEWNEPGCADSYFYESGGLDIFEASRETKVFAQTKTVYEDGEHLIVIESDMNAEVFVSVDIIEPGTR
jgi:hypothetical protein